MIKMIQSRMTKHEGNSNVCEMLFISSMDIIVYYTLLDVLLRFRDAVNHQNMFDGCILSVQDDGGFCNMSFANTKA